MENSDLFHKKKKKKKFSPRLFQTIVASRLAKRNGHRVPILSRDQQTVN